MSNTNTSELLKSLNVLYEKGSYQEAVDLVLKHKGDYAPAVFHEHLGTLYLKLQDIGPARYHLEKAVQNGLVSADVRHNLNTAKSLVTTPDLDRDHSLYGQVVSHGLSLPAGTLMTLSLLIIFTTLLLKKFQVLKSNLAVISLLVIGVFPLAFEKTYLDKIHYGIALKETSLLEGPSKIYPEITKLEPGVKFIIGKSKDGWSLIKFPENLVGWVRKQDIGVFE